MGRAYAVGRHRRLIAVVGTFLMGCAFLLLVVGCAGTLSEAPKEEKQQEHTEATNKEQGHTAEATASEEARCEGTRTIRNPLGLLGTRRLKTRFTTNDLPDCPDKGGLLLGTEGRDELAGEDGDDEVRGLGDNDILGGGDGDDVIYGGPGKDIFVAGKGDDVIYGGPGNDEILVVGPGEDVLYGGDGNDVLEAAFQSGNRDRLYCGKGIDQYAADKNDYVDSSCEKKGGAGWGNM